MDARTLSIIWTLADIPQCTPVYTDFTDPDDAGQSWLRTTGIVVQMAYLKTRESGSQEA
jgi:hypothetical protein